MSLPAGKHLLYNLKDAGLHMMEFMFASSSSNRKDHL